MIKLSVVIITFNEEKNIASCLESVKEIADEILIVDSYSKDNTKSICESYGAKFVEHPFNGHIQQKNYAASIAEYDYVLSLDADEVLSDKLKQSIINIKENFIADGYEFNRLNNYCGTWIKHSGWYPDSKLRLWDRRKGAWGGENPHDKYIMEEGSVIKKLKGDLLHYSYHSVFEHIAQVNKFSEIGAQEAVRKGRKMNIFKIILFPLWKFIKNYFIKGGFLDGYKGFVVCVITTHEAFVKYVKTMELQNRAKQ